jgi:hypothetical protein
MLVEDPSPLMPPQDTHVFLVEAKRSPLKNLHCDFLAYQDLRPQWGCFGYGGWMGGDSQPSYYEDNDYYKSKGDLHHAGEGVVVPAGTYFRIVDVAKSSYVADGSDIQSFEDLETGTRLVLECLDPRDENKRLRFVYWSHNETARKNFGKVTNQMVMLAIAATGL